MRNQMIQEYGCYVRRLMPKNKKGKMIWLVGPCPKCKRFMQVDMDHARGAKDFVCNGRLKNDQYCGGHYYVEWKPVEHPSADKPAMQPKLILLDVRIDPKVKERLHAMIVMPSDSSVH